jgi:hypothetical protein
MTKAKKVSFVHYVDNSTPKIKYFNSESSMKRFVNKFLKENPDPMDGYWVDFYVLNAERVVLKDNRYFQEGAV